MLCVAKNRDWSRKIAPLSNLTRASLLVEWKLTAKAELNCEILKKMLEKSSQFLSSEQPCEPKSLDVALKITGVEKNSINLFVIVLSILVYYVFYCMWQINKIKIKKINTLGNLWNMWCLTRIISSDALPKGIDRDHLPLSSSSYSSTLTGTYSVEPQLTRPTTLKQASSALYPSGSARIRKVKNRKAISRER